MFCRHCGNEIIDGSRYCDKCGKPVEYRNNDNQTNYNQNQEEQNQNNYNAESNFENDVYRMSKKEYFQSGFCSPGAVKKKKWSWIIFGIFTAFTVVSLIWNAVGIASIFSSINLDGSASEVLRDFAEIYEIDYELIEEFVGDFEEVEKETGVKAGEIFKISIIITLVMTAIAYAACILLAFLGIKNTNFGCALAAMIVGITSVGTLSAIVGTVLIFIFTVKCNNEYKEYCRGGFSNNGYSDEPYFG